jgi:hypothetical protein
MRPAPDIANARVALPETGAFDKALGDHESFPGSAQVGSQLQGVENRLACAVVAPPDYATTDWRNDHWPALDSPIFLPFT